MNYSIAHSTHENPVLSEAVEKNIIGKPSECVDHRNQTHRNCIKHHALGQILSAVDLRTSQMVERLFEQLSIGEPHNGTASERIRSSSSGLIPFSNTTSTGTPTTSVRTWASFA